MIMDGKDSDSEVFDDETPTEVESNVEEKISDYLLSRNIFFISGEIEAKIIEKAIKWILYENMHPAENKKLTMYINSEGGNLMDAFALIDVMKLSKCPIRTIAVGSLMSAAFMIFIAGTKGERFISKNTTILSHQFSMEQEGKAHEIQAAMNEVKFCNERMVSIISECCNMRRDTIEKKLLPPSDVWLTAKDAIRLGVADKILT
jgi:ATP-dependent Clp endopeptidase proteolytic subunit ClpP